MQSTYELIIVDDGAAMTTVVPVHQGELGIGRQLGNAILLPERNISRRHARLVRTGDEVGIEDLGSYTGVRVNGQPIAGSASLHAGDQVQIGDYCLALRRVAVAARPAERIAPSETVAPIPAAPEVPPAAVGSNIAVASEQTPESRPASGAPPRQPRAQVNTQAWWFLAVGALAVCCGVISHRLIAEPGRKQLAAQSPAVRPRAERESGLPPSLSIPAQLASAPAVTAEPPPRVPTRRGLQSERSHTRTARTDSRGAGPLASETELTPEQAAELLAAAQAHYIKGEFAEAIRVARRLQADPGGTMTRAWRILGTAACKLGDLDLLSQAYRRVDVVSRQYMLYICQQSGVTLSSGRFVRAP